jgi:hypothetical protein
MVIGNSRDDLGSGYGSPGYLGTFSYDVKLIKCLFFVFVSQQLQFKTYFLPTELNTSTLISSQSLKNPNVYCLPTMIDLSSPICLPSRSPRSNESIELASNWFLLGLIWIILLFPCSPISSTYISESVPAQNCLPINK